MSLDNARNSAYVYQKLNFGTVVEVAHATSDQIIQPDSEYAGPLSCETCGHPLTAGQLKRGARFCSSSCRSKGHEARDPRLSNASIEQLEGELLKRLGKAAGEARDKEVTVRAWTRNVRVLRLTWMKVRSMTPSGKTFMQTLEKLVHEAWLSKEGA